MEKHNSDELMQCTPPYLKEVAESAQVDLLPKKSRTKYEAAFESFQKFKKDQKTSATSQNVVFSEEAVSWLRVETIRSFHQGTNSQIPERCSRYAIFREK